MDFTRLAAKQKRYQDIQRFNQTETADPQLRENICSSLTAYRKALAACWLGKDDPKVENEHALENIERELDTLQNLARLRAR